jgi:hypothetical protein
MIPSIAPASSSESSRVEQVAVVRHSQVGHFPRPTPATKRCLGDPEQFHNLGGCEHCFASPEIVDDRVVLCRS